LAGFNALQYDFLSLGNGLLFWPPCIYKVAQKN